MYDGVILYMSGDEIENLDQIRKMSSLQELARRLHQERLFVQSEQESIRNLNSQIRQRTEDLSHMFWTTRQHHLNLNHFITNSAQATPVVCAQRATKLDNAQFVDGYKELGYQDSMYGNFLQAFRSNPTLAAACFAYGEKLGIESTYEVVQSVVLGVYGNSIITDDHHHLLELMETLMLLQLAGNEEPRRVLQKGNAAFCIVYKLFTESLLSGRLFLTSSLHKPVMQVLMDDELYLERDFNKILDCYSQVEKEKRFGRKGEPEFENRIKEHLELTEQRLYKICQSFINSLSSAMFCFPQSLGWVISRAYHIVKEAGLVTHAEARALCADLMLQMFICPAIVNPELYGVTGDAPISEFTRFNLMQIAQVLQVLALWDSSTQPSDNSLYNRFNKSCMSSILDTVINTWHTDGLPSPTTPESGFVSCAAFLTPVQLVQLIEYLRDIQQSNVRGVDQSSVVEILSHLPETPPACLAQVMQQRDSWAFHDSISAEGDNSAALGNILRSGTVISSSAMPSPHTPIRSKTIGADTSPSSSKKLFSKSVKTPKGKYLKSSNSIDSGKTGSVDSPSVKTRNIKSKSGSGSGDSLQEENKVLQQDATEIVLVISLNGANNLQGEPPGMLSEQEVLEMHSTRNLGDQDLHSVADGVAPLDSATLNDADSERMDKRLRFSLYSTDFSELGEGGIEATSSTSGSSMEDMDQTESVPADDTSSFRGTSSHGNQYEEDEMEEGDLESIPHTNNDEALKALERKLPTSRESIEDKMRKFEIRPQLGVRFGGAVVAGLESEEDRMEGGGHGSGNSNYLDTRSDTWSTDAYASDSEPPPEQEEQAAARLQEIAENPDQVPGQIRTGNPGGYLALLPRDEDSRSDVWSVEVLPSDSEPPDVKPEDRLQELESESNAGVEDAIDPLEDSRSRASTPGLSAASGVSGASGLSLVSDNVHSKAGDEHGSSSERSFGKTTSSISPDADDMLSSNRVSGAVQSSRLSASSSSHSSGSGEAQTTHQRPQTAPSVGSHGLMDDHYQSPVHLCGQDGKGPAGRNKAQGGNGVIRSKSASPACPGQNKALDQKKHVPGIAFVVDEGNRSSWKRDDEKKSNITKSDIESSHPSGPGAAYNCNFLDGQLNSPLDGTKPEAASTPDERTGTLHEVIMDSNHHTNTIKRSPYKPADSIGVTRVSAFNSVPSSLARNIAAEASLLEKTNAGAGSGRPNYYDMNNVTIHHKTDPVQSAITVFDPLAGTEHKERLEKAKNSRQENSNNAVSSGIQAINISAASVPTSTFIPITSMAATLSPSPASPNTEPSTLDSLVTAGNTHIVSKPTASATGNSLLNLNSMSAALVDLSVCSNGQAHAVQVFDEQSQVPSPVPVQDGGARSKVLLRPASFDQDNGKSIERKKSWWKNPRLPVLSSKRRNMKSAQDERSSVFHDAAISEKSEVVKPVHLQDDSPQKGQPTSASSANSFNLDLSGEDIMQKYMKKVVSNQSLTNISSHDNAVGSNSTSDPTSSSADITDRSDLNATYPSDKTNESQSLSNSSTTDAHSTPSNISSATSDRTVTTVTQGTSVNSSVSFNRESEQVDSVIAKEEHKPDAAQLLFDTEKKLRLMLSTAENLPESSRYSVTTRISYHMDFPLRPNTNCRDTENASSDVLSFLQLQLAEAVSLQDHSRVAQIHETTRCVLTLDNQGCKVLLQNLWKKYKERSIYIAYLIRTKQSLLTTSSYLQHQFYCTERDQITCRRYLTSVCVGLFLKRMDKPLRKFRQQFSEATVADEKVALVRSFLSMLYGQMAENVIWENAREDQLAEAERAIERSVFVYIYKLALYPNGDGDVMRDQLIHRHISRLSAVVTTQHPALLIPQKYLNECPWPSAQAEARSVNAYKRPRDKLSAVLRCCNTIMNLLKLADEGTVPGADDFTPVLVYVLIKANPPNLLSTVQYITSFIGDELTGEDSYWWMQFTAATEFIKTIDERI